MTGDDVRMDVGLGLLGGVAHRARPDGHHGGHGPLAAARAPAAARGDRRGGGAARDGCDPGRRAVDPARRRADDDAGRALHGLRRRSAASRSTTTTRRCRWSVDDLEGFWAAIWDFFGVRAHTPYERVLSERVMPGAKWFEGATLNYAEHMVGPDEDLDRVAVLARSQTRDPFELTFADLREQVARARAGLAAPRRRPRRPRRRLPAEHPRDARRVPRDREPRRGLGDVRARVRRPRGDRPLRHRRAEGAARGRRLRLRRQARRPPRRGRRDPRRRCATLEHVVHVPYAGGADDALPGRARVGRPRRRARAAALRPGAVRPPALRAVLVRHDRPAEADRPRPRRHPRRAPQEPRPELGPAARRPPACGSRRPRG